MLCTARQLSARTRPRTTIPANVIGVSTKYSSDAELINMMENMTNAGKRMANSRDVLEFTETSPTKP